MANSGSSPGSSRKKLRKQKAAMVDSGSSSDASLERRQKKKKAAVDDSAYELEVLKRLEEVRGNAVSLTIDDPEDLELTTAAKLALYHYNYRCETKYMFTKLLSADARCTASCIYYITFEAAEKGNHYPAAVKTFQSTVVQRLPNEKLEVHLCSLKNECPISDEKVSAKSYMHRAHEPENCYCLR